MLSSSDVNFLGQILNDTWGQSTRGDFRSPTMSIRTSLQGDCLSCVYTTIVHLASERNLRDQVKVFEDESTKLIGDYIKELKKEFKNSSGRAIKLKELSSSDNVELITASPFTPRKTAYYRRFTRFRIE
ncbi:MAG: hypothetical protein CMB80_10745 [Flammeovirgaceae bacterium]|nr:hypothetical protein [Flammeovirgaceae bacterium]